MLVKHVKRELPEEMEDEIAAIAAEVLKNQSLVGVRDGDVGINVIFRCYLDFTDGKKKKESMIVPEPSQQEYIKEGKAQKFTRDLEFKGSFASATGVPGKCELLPDSSGYRFLVQNKYKNVETRSLLLEHGKLYYENKAPDKRFQYGLYVSKEGVIAEEMWITVKFKDVITISVGDAHSKLFRTTNCVVSRSMLSCVKVEVKHDISVKEIDQNTGEKGPDDKKITKKVKVLQAFTSFKCQGKVQLMDDTNSSLSENERIHLMEAKDVHHLVPIREVHSSPPEENVYFYACHRYSSEEGSLNGVTISKLQNIDDSDYTYTTQDKVVHFEHNVRMLVIQWHNTKTIKAEQKMFSVDIKCAGNLWRNFGITHEDSYIGILKAHYDVTVHVDAKLWTDELLRCPQNAPDKLGPLSGYYKYSGQSLVPDYIEYFYRGGALQLSKTRVLKEFQKFVATNDETGVKSLMLPMKATNTANYFNYAGAESIVVSLGTAIHPGIFADVWPIMGVSDFFVMTSYTLSLTEKSKYFGTIADEFFDALLKEVKDVRYWIFAINRSVLASRESDQPKVKQITLLEAPRITVGSEEEKRASPRRPAKKNKKN